MKPSPVRQAIDAVLASLPSAESRRAYEHDWMRYAVWLELEGVLVVEARPRHVVAHVAHLREVGIARSSLGRALSVVRAVYGELVRDGVIESNPAREVKNPKSDVTPKTPYLNEEQVRALVNLPAKTWREKRDRLCLRLLFGIGWRRSEIARLKVESFNSERRTVTGKVKGGKVLTVGVPEWLLQDVVRWCAVAGIETGAILPRREHSIKAISGDIVYKIVKNAEERAGLPLGSVSPHGLRRTSITISGERGVSLKERQLSVGHTSQSTTERYDQARDAARSAPGQVFEDLID